MWGSTSFGEVALVLHGAAQHERALGAAGDLDRLRRALVGVDAPEADRARRRRWPRTAARRRRRRDGSSRRTSSSGTRSASEIETKALRGARVGGQDPRRGEPVDRRHHRRPGERREGERQPVEVVVDQVELRRAAAARGRRGAPPRPARRSSRPPRRGARRRRRAGRAVIESSVANSVTSTPRGARPSASSPVTSSHGP